MEDYSAATVNLEAGQVGGANCDAFAGSEINIHGGSVGRISTSTPRASVNMSGGVVARLDALADSTVRLDDGSITSLQATTGSHTIWKGGTMGALSVSGTAAPWPCTESIFSSMVSLSPDWLTLETRSN